MEAVRHSRSVLALATLLLGLSPTSAPAQDAADLVGHTLTGTSPDGPEWAAYYASDGTLYTLNAASGERFIESFSVEGGRLCYPQDDRCWSVRIESDQVTVSSEERGSHSAWTLQPGDPLDLVAQAERACVHSHDGSDCA